MWNLPVSFCQPDSTRKDRNDDVFDKWALLLATQPVSSELTFLTRKIKISEQMRARWNVELQVRRFFSHFLPPTSQNNCIRLSTTFVLWPQIMAITNVYLPQLLFFTAVVAHLENKQLWIPWQQTVENLSESVEANLSSLTVLTEKVYQTREFCYSCPGKKTKTNSTCVQCHAVCCKTCGNLLCPICTNCWSNLERGKLSSSMLQSFRVHVF